MSYAKLEQAIMSARDITPTAKLAYSAIISHYRNEDSEMFPSYSTIGKLMGCSRRNAIRAVNMLVSAGYITKESRINVDHNGLASNKYNLVTKLSPPSDKVVTTSSDKVVTTPSDKVVTLNKESLKRENLNNLKKATGSAQCEPEQPEQTDKRQTLTARLQLLGNNTEWLEVVELYGKAYLRFSSPISHKYTDIRTIRTATAFLSDLGIVSEPEILKHNQYRAEGAII